MLEVYARHGNVELFVANFNLGLTRHDHYLHEKNVRDRLVGLVKAGNIKRARQFVDNLPDVTASKLVVGLQLAGIALALLFALALVIGLAVFLWQHFFG